MGDPHPLFDHSYYLDTYPDIAEAGINPLRHYVEVGGREGRSPHPLFDGVFYLQRNPGVAAAGVNPLQHYLEGGALEGRDPHPLFDAAYYLRMNPGVVAEGINPLLHYLQSGAREGRDPHPLFDGAFYFVCHPDLDPERINPLVHYVRYGGYERRNPSPFFDARFYLEVNQEIREAGMNPLVHFVLHGIHERRPCRPLATARTCGRRFFDLAERALTRSREMDTHTEDAAFRLYLPEAAPGDAVEVSIVVPVHNHVEMTLRCLHSLRSHRTRHSFEVLVVDDASSDITPRIIAPMPFVRYLRSETNRGFAVACNLGAKHARAAFLVFLNNDTLVCDGWLDALRQTFNEWPAAGMVGSKLVHPDRRLQECGGLVFRNASTAAFGRGGHPDDSRFCHTRQVDYASAAAVMIRRSLFEELGGFDERYERAYYEDVDMAFATRERGWQVLVNPHAMVVHHEGTSARPALGNNLNEHVATNRNLFLDRWGEIVSNQPEQPAVALQVAPEQPRVLFLDENIPNPNRDAGSLRVIEILRILLEEGCHTTIGAWNPLAVGEDAARLERMGVEVLRPTCGDDLDHYIALMGSSFDLVVLSRRFIAARFIDTAKRYCPHARILFDTVDLHFVREARGNELGAEVVSECLLDRRTAEIHLARRCDVTLVVSERERTLLQQLAPTSDVRVLSLIFDAQPTTRRFADRDGILFVGYFTHLPNVDAVLWFVREALPLIANAPTFHIVGSDPPGEVRALASERVQVHGHVPDIRAMFDACRVSVAPLRFGAGVKGKIVQSFALGVPCVTTPIGAEGIPLRRSYDSIVADDAPSFVANVRRMLTDEKAWTAARQDGLELVQNSFSRGTARTAIRALLKGTMSNSTPDVRLTRNEGFRAETVDASLAYRVARGSLLPDGRRSG